MTAFHRLLQISWRNIFRNKRRSILTMGILVLGSTGLILVGGFFQSLREGYREQYIHSQTGHLQVSKTGFFNKGASAPFDFLMGDVTALRNEIESHPAVHYTISRLKFGGMISNQKTSIAVMAMGTEAEAEKRMGSARGLNPDYSSTHLIQGQDLDPKDPQGVLLGKGLQEALDVKLGDSVDFITTRQAGAIDGAELHVRGVFETIAKDFDERVMKLNLATAQELLDAGNQVHSLQVLLNDTGQTDATREDFAARFKAKGWNLETVTWVEQGSFYRQADDMLRRINFIIQAIISVIFFFSIANTINMALFERMREFGTMMAIGNSRAVIFSTILLEAILLGLMGSALGLLIGSAAAQAISSIGIEMPPIPMGSSSYYAVITLTPQLLAETFAISLSSTLLSSLVPAYRASHFPIIQALSYV